MNSSGCESNVRYSKQYVAEKSSLRLVCCLGKCWNTNDERREDWDLQEKKVGR